MSETAYGIIVIATMALVTLFIRAIPFCIFERGGKVPKVVEFLGKALPPAMMSFLLVYCVRNADYLGTSHGLPELLGVAIAMVLHVWKGNTFLSIGLATVAYMIMVQFIF